MFDASGGRTMQALTAPSTATASTAATAPIDPTLDHLSNLYLLISQLFRLLSLEFFCDSFHSVA
jgi:hypothetical protein